MSINPQGYKLSDRTGKLTAEGKLYSQLNVNISLAIQPSNKNVFLFAICHKKTLKEANTYVIVTNRVNTNMSQTYIVCKCY